MIGYSDSSLPAPGPSLLDYALFAGVVVVAVVFVWWLRRRAKQ